MPGFMMGAARFDVPVEGLKWVTDLLDKGYDFESDLGVAKPMGIPSRRTVCTPVSTVGVVAAISPWNVPTQGCNLAKSSAGPRGRLPTCGVLSSRHGHPWVAAELGRWCRRAHRRGGRIQRRDPALQRGRRLSTSDPRVDMVSFTRSTATGKAIMAAAAPTLKTGSSSSVGGESPDRARTVRDIASAAGATAFTACVHAGPGLRDHHPR